MSYHDETAAAWLIGFFAVFAIWFGIVLYSHSRSMSSTRSR